MKKLIAISVMLALVAGAAFAADFSLGWQASFGYSLVSSTNEADAVIGGRFLDNYKLHINFEGENAGGQLRFLTTGQDMAHVWWKPIEQFKIYFGNSDGNWGAAAIGGWGFLAAAKFGDPNDSGAVPPAHPALENPFVKKYSNGFGFYGGTGWNSHNFELSIYPMDALAINFAVKGIGDPGFATDVLVDKLDLNVNYQISGVGKLNVSADFGETDSKFFLSFFVNEAIDGIGIDLGFAYSLATNAPIEIGYGFSFDGGDFGFKARGGVSIPTVDTAGAGINIGLLPSYNLGALTVYGHLGMLIELPASSASGADPTIGFWINPYVNINAVNGFDFYIGFALWNPDVKNGKMSWGVPVGFSINL